jgi:hypothetical protein
MADEIQLSETQPTPGANQSTATTTPKRTRKKSKRKVLNTNEKTAKVLAKNTEDVLKNLSSDELENVIEIASRLVAEKVKEEVETAEKVLNEKKARLEKYKK